MGTSANPTSFAKTFGSSDLTKKPFSMGKEFNVIHDPVYYLQTLSKLLNRLEGNPTQTIVRGSLIEVIQIFLYVLKKPREPVAANVLLLIKKGFAQDRDTIDQ